MSTPATAVTPAVAVRGRRLLVMLGSLLLGMVLASLDQTIIATALPTIVGELGGLSLLAWAMTAYLLASTASTPLWGKLGDLYGRKGFFQAAIVVFLGGWRSPARANRWDNSSLSAQSRASTPAGSLSSASPPSSPPTPSSPPALAGRGGCGG